MKTTNPAYALFNIATETARATLETLADTDGQLDVDRQLPGCRRIILSAMERAIQGEYGRGVTAGKLEALNYTPEERERYAQWVTEAGGSLSVPGDNDIMNPEP